ncbi:dTDP-4-dehydrorhamnose reductase [Psychromarinibacter sp. C21-152]|uniref:dTDP-4-dehydrorhamnose reductase n=1 Tax=Psychromarinibacter sediminicola TaxID=3033385 RepID=A0AAE3NPI4_9RHOB|nr:dTDP-4-dehydrorhamnose reductase [Psychromarinibacter sediminicola]MDF0599637.1 dTDP-4-dehydrorhamnose reductase [Psychromarinibacter sediminicola]
MILVFGRTGQLARALARAAPAAVCLDRAAADLAHPEACAAAIAAHRPAAVINAAAYTAVDRAEAEEAQAHRVNADAPAAMARACAGLGVPFVHLSTDYVFGGAGGRPIAPDAPTGPLSAYGRSKLAGERGVRAAGGVHAILRTSWVFSAHGRNFVTTVLRLSEARDALRIVDDQIGGPTPAADLAAACLSVAQRLQDAPALSGTYHYAGRPEVSRKGFAEAIVARSGRKVRVEGIPSAAYPTAAARPLDARLDCSRTEAALGLARPDWRAGLDAVLRELGIGPAREAQRW